MNKYQDALNLLRAWAQQDRNAYSPKHLENINNRASVLQKLVDKTNPMIPNEKYIIDGMYYMCPRCESIIIEKRIAITMIRNGRGVPKVCDECAQSINWRLKDESSKS